MSNIYIEKESTSEDSTLQRRVTPDKKCKKSEVMIDDLVETSKLETYSSNEYCFHCAEHHTFCHNVQFRHYCTDAVDAQFRQSPLDMSKKSITLTFTRTY